VRCLKVNLGRGKLIDFPRQRDRVQDTFLDTEVDAARKLNDFNPKLVEAVGIEQPAVRLIPTILERFRGQVSPRTPSNNTNQTR
jgi:hypothetical protein